VKRSSDRIADTIKSGKRPRSRARARVINPLDFPERGEIAVPERAIELAQRIAERIGGNDA
jgi:hypothetical protein